MNRFKLLLVLLILLVLSLLYVQNQQPLTLRLFCADVNQSCLYQTPQLPLAVWLFAFTLAGVLTSLIWQLFNRFGYPAVKPRELAEPTNFNYEPENLSGFEAERRTISEERRSTPEPNRQPSPSVFENNNVSRSDWEDTQNNNDWNIEQPPSVTIKDSRINSQTEQAKSYDTNQEPTNVQRSGSTYSYTYREASNDRSQEKKEEPKIYDANYRMINPPYKPVEERDNSQDEDDEDWI
jgi:uncharacterized integral membrane protein